MAQFKPGQRVKRVRDPYLHSAAESPLPIGATGTVIGPSYRGAGYVAVMPDGQSLDWQCQADTLAPLLPPDEKAEQFMEWVRTLDGIRELQPDEMERVRSAG